MPIQPGQAPPIRLPATRDKPLTPQQEVFVLGLARGMTKRAAYRAAGYGKSATGYTRLLTLPHIAARLDQLLGETRALNRITIEEVTQRLLGIVERNETVGSVPAQNLARLALMDLAKLHGLLIDKHEFGGVGAMVIEVRRTIVDPAPPQ